MGKIIVLPDSSREEKTGLISHCPADVAIKIEDSSEADHLLPMLSPSQYHSQPSHSTSVTCAVDVLTDDHDSTCTSEPKIHRSCQSLGDCATQSPDGVNDAKCSNADARHGCARVQFFVGQDRQLMIGRECELAAISPVFSAMLCERWRGEGRDVDIDIPDVGTGAFGIILRCAAKDTDLKVSEDTVWDVLKAADMYQVDPVVQRCFHFLLHDHKLRHRIRHLCAVTETAHRLGHSRQHEDCMALVKSRADRVLRSSSGLAELCHKCMLSLITCQHLSVAEIVINDAVVTWARCACAQRGETTPGWDTLRATAGELIYQVRYMTMPRRTLENFLAAKEGQPSSCLLTASELTSLLQGDSRSFPSHVDCKRGRKLSRCNVPKKEDTLKIVFVIGLLLLFLFSIVYVVTRFIVFQIG